MLFSATLNRSVMELAYEFMNVPDKVSVTPEQMTAERVEQVLYHASRKEKFPLLLGLLKKEGMERTMIFVNTKREAEFLHDRLNANGFPCRVISGDVEQRKRLRILEDFKDGTLPMLIATDVASRGLHIDGVSHVINYDLPQDCEDYVHRIGRTARAGAEGKAISLADEDGAFYVEAIEELSRTRSRSSGPRTTCSYTITCGRSRSRGNPGPPVKSHTENVRPASLRIRTAAQPASGSRPTTGPAAATGEGEAKKKRRRPRRKKPAGETPAPE